MSSSFILDTIKDVVQASNIYLFNDWTTFGYWCNNKDEFNSQFSPNYLKDIGPLVVVSGDVNDTIIISTANLDIHYSKKFRADEKDAMVTYICELVKKCKKAIVEKRVSKMEIDFNE